MGWKNNFEMDNSFAKYQAGFHFVVCARNAGEQIENHQPEKKSLNGDKYDMSTKSNDSSVIDECPLIKWIWLANEWFRIFGDDR